MPEHAPVPLLDLKAQYDALRDEIEPVLERVVESQYFVLGPEVDALETEMAAYLADDAADRGADAGPPSGRDMVSGGPVHAVGCASGTDALLLPLRAIRAGDDAPADAHPGDVVVPAFTFFATAGAVWNAGFRPVFCDVDPETFNVTPNLLGAAWTERTRAVVPVHLFGQMAPVEEIVELARERDARVVEDAAQAIGARRAVTASGAPAAGAAAGTVGDFGAFSFFPTKNLGGFGDGGMVTARDPELAERVRKLRVHGGRQMYHHEMVGTNSRLDALQAAVLRVKLRHLDRWAAARRENAARYDALLSDVDGVRTPVTAPSNVHTYNQYTLRVEDRDDLRSFLAERHIGSGLYYPVPLHLQDCFAELGYRRGDLPVSEALCEQVVSLPVFPELGRERLERVAGAIREFYGA